MFKQVDKIHDSFFMEISLVSVSRNACLLYSTLNVYENVLKNIV